MTGNTVMAGSNSYTRAEDIMADNSLSPRAQPEDEYYSRHHI